MFSGSGSVGEYLKKLGYDVVSLDINPRFHPTFAVDILKWDYRNYLSPGQFKIVAASPPCQEYSAAKSTGQRDLVRANAIVRKTLEIIQWLKPEFWWIENQDTVYSEIKFSCRISRVSR